MRHKIGAEIIEGLTDLCETLEKNEPVETKFVVFSLRKTEIVVPHVRKNTK